uniref:Tripartite motif containing 35-28 n=1 Tax=Periophthalmus magnuspinnatus TaxID=409849 RepID=A0A3B3Z6L0_9GOBI
MSLISLFEDFLTCPICLEPLKEPVSLSCHHSFCQNCLYKTWNTSPNKACPMCRRRSSRETVEVKEPKVKQAQVCSSHPSVPPLFCLEEARALCPVCEFSLHSHHTVVSEDEAKKRVKEQVQTQIQALKDQKQSYEELEKTYQQLQRHHEEQTVECMAQITHVFSQFHRILKEEEDRALGALSAEKNRQTLSLGLELQKVRKEITTLTNNIQDLQNSIVTQSLLSAPTQSCTPLTPQPHPQPKEGLCLNQARILGNLGYRVWTKMKSVVSYSPVILDPNTAESSMHLSQDLCGMRHGPPMMQPVVPERFTNEPIVLGSEGFSHGQHQWDVEVGDLPTWDIGVVKKSIDRRGQIYAGANYGVWCLWHGDGAYTSGNDVLLPVDPAPKKIRVTLDYEKGELCFYDAELMIFLVKHNATPRKNNKRQLGSATSNFHFHGVNGSPTRKKVNIKIRN